MLKIHFPSLGHRRAGPACLGLVLTALPFGLLAASAVADPTDARIPVAPLIHRSTLQLRPPAPEASGPGDWRAANERVRAVGGWKAYLREAQQPDPQASAPKDRTSGGPTP